MHEVLSILLILFIYVILLHGLVKVFVDVGANGHGQSIRLFHKFVTSLRSVCLPDDDEFTLSNKTDYEGDIVVALQGITRAAQHHNQMQLHERQQQFQINTNKKRKCPSA
jgi:hypothetical protein